MTKRAVYELAAEIGAEVDDLGDSLGLLVSVWAPTGLVWVGSGCHVSTTRWFGPAAEGWRAVLADLRKGTEPCTEAACEVCAEGAA